MKKKIFFVAFLGILIFGLCTPVFAKNIASCDSVISNSVIIDERIPNIVSTIITIIKIVVPILLVIFGMLDLVKAMISQKEDEIKKGQNLFIKRLISGALVFFVFTIVQLIISFVTTDEDKNIMSCSDCFINNNCTYRKNSDGTCEKGTELSKNGKVCVPDTK